jgi:hypothetical protein
MSSSILAAFVIPFALAVAYMLWVLWNLTMELRPTKRAGDTQGVIPVQTLAYRTTRPAKINSSMTSSEARAARN